MKSYKGSIYTILYRPEGELSVNIKYKISGIYIPETETTPEESPEIIRIRAVNRYTNETVSLTQEESDWIENEIWMDYDYANFDKYGWGKYK